MVKYIEFSFIRNQLYQEMYNDELKDYIIQTNNNILLASNIEKFISFIIEIAQLEIDKGRYKVASYMYGLIHNLPKNEKDFNSQVFFSYDFLSFYENMLDYKRIDILKKVLKYLPLLI